MFLLSVEIYTRNRKHIEISNERLLLRKGQIVNAIETHFTI